MRRIVRLSLPPKAQSDLDRRQKRADGKRAAGRLNVRDEWKNAQQTKPLKQVRAVLGEMMGRRERCMYCLDSRGGDIEHFWPKTPYPERMFAWPNLLLCCTDCGRLKGDRFPLVDGRPLLIDPTVVDPWDYLDFDPETGNIVPRFEVATKEPAPMGAATVATLQLDRREALAVGYLKSWRRLAGHIEGFLSDRKPTAAALPDILLNDDEHGLLGWLVRGPGQTLGLVGGLRQNHPEVWKAIVARAD